MWNRRRFHAGVGGLAAARRTGRARHGGQGRRAGPRPQIAPLPPVPLTTMGGESRSLERELANDVPLVLNFVFTTCSTSCSLQTAVLAQLQRDWLARGRHLQLASITIDPDNDTPETAAPLRGGLPHGSGLAVLYRPIRRPAAHPEALRRTAAARHRTRRCCCCGATRARRGCAWRASAGGRDRSAARGAAGRRLSMPGGAGGCVAGAGLELACGGSRSRPRPLRGPRGLACRDGRRCGRGLRRVPPAQRHGQLRGRHRRAADHRADLFRPLDRDTGRYFGASVRWRVRPAYDEQALARLLLRTGITPDGITLPATMPRYAIDDAQRDDLAAYLRGSPPGAARPRRRAGARGDDHHARCRAAAARRDARHLEALRGTEERPVAPRGEPFDAVATHARDGDVPQVPRLGSRALAAVRAARRLGRTARRLPGGAAGLRRGGGAGAARMGAGGRVLRAAARARACCRWWTSAPRPRASTACTTTRAWMRTRARAPAC